MKKNQTFSKKIIIIQLFLFMLFSSLAIFSLAWFTDYKKLSDTVSFGDIIIKVDDTTTEDKSSQDLFLSVYRGEEKLPEDSKILPGDELRITVRVTNLGEDCYYLICLSDSENCLGENFNRDYFVKEGELYHVVNTNEGSIKTYLSSTNEIVTNDASLVGALDAGAEESITISRKIDKNLTQEDVRDILNKDIHVICDVIAIQQANITEIEAYKELKSNTFNASETELTLGYSYIPTLDLTSYAKVASSYPWVYDPAVLNFENQIISKIQVPVKSVAAIDENQTFTVVVLPSVKVTNGTLNGSNVAKNFVRQYNLTVPYEQIQECSDPANINKWITFDNLEIVCNEGETLGFSYKTDTVSWAYAKGGATSCKMYGISGTYTLMDESLPFRVYKESNSTSNLRNILSGKYLSVLGDSISTYEGYSNDYINTNSALQYNLVHYNDENLGSVDNTYWKQIIDKYNMNLCVDNGWGSAQVLGNANGNLNGYWRRPSQLHDNTIENNANGEEVYPDVILVYMGVNDAAYNQPTAPVLTNEDFTRIQEQVDSLGNDYRPENFSEAYATMIYKITKNYVSADVFCLTVPTHMLNRNQDLLVQYNNAIRQVCEYFNIGLVELEGSVLDAEDTSEYTIDGVHPNALGMDVMTSLIEKALRNKYLA